jgi:phage terminase large subunit GpA-like protein
MTSENDLSVSSRLVSALIELFEPKPQMWPDEWGRANRTYDASAGLPGPRDPSITPYTIPWIRAAASGLYEMCVFICGYQMGKTDSELDLVGARLSLRPCPILFVGLSKEFMQDQIEPRLVAMIEQSPSLSAKLDRTRNKKTLKYINNVPVRLAHSSSSGGALKSDPQGLCIVDEYDSFLENVHGSGDPLGQIRARGRTYSDYTICLSSTPTIGSSDVTDGTLQFWKMQEVEDIESKVWLVWQQGSKGHWCWPCPLCQEYFIPRLDRVRWPKDSTPEEARRAVWMECPHCGGVIPIDDPGVKRDLNARGHFVCPGQEIDKDGTITGSQPAESIQSFWVWGGCSPFVTVGALVEDYLQAIATRDPNRIQSAVNGFGELFRLGFGADAPKWSDVSEHKSVYARGEAPDGIIFVVVTVDVQARSLIYVARGWGARSTSWLLDWGQFFGETQHDEVWAALHDYITNTICGFPVRMVLIDSGFRPGRTDQPIHKVYDFCRRFGRGKVMPTKGSSHPMSKPLVVSKQEITIKGKAMKCGIDLLMLDSGYRKSWVHERLHWEKNQLGDWHLPCDVDDDYMKQIISESKARLPSGKVVWVEHSPKNHFLDCEALQAAASHILNTARIPPTIDVMQRRPPFANNPPKKEPAPAPAPAPAPSAPGGVIPEDPKAAPVAEGYWEEHTRRELENRERVAAENRLRFLDPHGLRAKDNFWDKEEG